MSNLSRTNALTRLRTISHLLDNAIAIPGTNYRIGIDPLLGLIPGGGDTVGAFLAAYIVIEAARLGLPKESLIRMVSNILIDSVLGAFPIVGDLFDFAWKANAKNVALIESHLNSPQTNQKAERWFIILLVAVLMMFVALVTAFGIIVIRLIALFFMGN